MAHVCMPFHGGVVVYVLCSPTRCRAPLRWPLVVELVLCPRRGTERHTTRDEKGPAVFFFFPCDVGQVVLAGRPFLRPGRTGLEG